MFWMRWLLPLLACSGFESHQKHFFLSSKWDTMQYFSYISVKENEQERLRLRMFLKPWIFVFGYTLVETAGGRSGEPRFAPDEQVSRCRVARTLFARMWPLRHDTCAESERVIESNSTYKSLGLSLSVTRSDGWHGQGVTYTQTPAAAAARINHVKPLSYAYD